MSELLHQLDVPAAQKFEVLWTGDQPSWTWPQEEIDDELPKRLEVTSKVEVHQYQIRPSLCSSGRPKRTRARLEMTNHKVLLWKVTSALFWCVLETKLGPSRRSWVLQQDNNPNCSLKHPKMPKNNELF